MNKKLVYKKYLILFGVLVSSFFLVFLIYRTINVVKAQERSWSQTDWRGGPSMQVVTQEVNTFSVISNIDYSGNGYVTLQKASNWHLDDWNSRVKIGFDNTLDNLGVGAEELLEYPVLVKLQNDINVDYDKTKIDGTDLRFVDTDGSILSHEIELWNPLGISYVWVKVPSISVGSEDFVYMYYGNESAENIQNPSNVWNSNYAGVWHMNEVEGTTIYDSTGRNNGTKIGGTLPSPASGPIDGAQLFGGNYVSIPNSASLAFNTSRITMSAWVNASSVPRWGTILMKASSQAWDNGYGFYLDGNLCAYVNHMNSRTCYAFPATSEYVYVVATYDGSSLKLFYNGVLVHQTARTLTINPGTGALTFAKGSGNNYWWYGVIDEVRISNSARSEAWIAASYSVGKDTFNSYDSIELIYPSSGYLTSNVIDTGLLSNWGNIVFNSTESDLVEIRVRTSLNADMSGSSEWHTCTGVVSGTDISSNGCVNDDQRYIQYQVLLSSETTRIPQFQDLTIYYSPADMVPPVTNAHELFMSDSVSNGGWVNFAPKINWSEGVDDDDGSGIWGYCIALDEVAVSAESSLLNPEITSGILDSLDDGVNGGCPFMVIEESVDLSEIEGLSLNNNKKYFFSIKAIDYGGKTWNGDASEYRDLISFKYDNVKPGNVMYISTPSSVFGSVSDMFFTWPTSGTVQASDDDSGLLGWQYAINSTDPSAWKGTTESDYLGMSYIPVGYESQTLYLDQDLHGSDVVVGNNTVYFRSLDIAGNFSTYVVGGLNYGGAAPYFPPESLVTISPSTSTENKFQLSWPTALAGDDKVVKSYYYMVNTQPPSSLSTLINNSTIYIPISSNSVSQRVLLGSVKGENTVYVVVVDNENNYSPSNAIRGTFVLNSSFPDAPLNLSVSDTSIKEASLWRVALIWDSPVYKGNGDLTYIIEKSLDGVTWSELDRIKGNAYSDTSSSSRRYYYRVATVDSTDESMNNPSYTNSVSVIPRGRYVTPPSLVSKPVVSSVSSRKATISWVTDRISDSKLQFGLSSNDYFESEIYTSSQVTEHVLDMNNLLPGTVYFVKAKWTDEDGNTGFSEEFVVETNPAPSVEDVKIGSIGLNFAMFNLTTNGASKARIIYGKSKAYGGAIEINTSISKSDYSIMLSDLEDGTDYNFKIVLTDIEGFEYESFEDHVFSTPPRPQIRNVQIQEKKGVPTPTVEVFWESNIAVNSIVKYSKGDITMDKVDMEMIAGEHVMEISGLDADSVYQLVVEGLDSMGNKAISDVYTFNTSIDTRPPEIFNIRSEGDIQSREVQPDSSRSSQLIISWETDEPSTSQVLYGEGASGDGFTYSTQTDSQMRYQHVVVLSNLSPSRVYHFRIVSKDAAGNIGESGSVTAITPKVADSVLESVMGSLGRIFGFINRL